MTSQRWMLLLVLSLLAPLAPGCGKKQGAPGSADLAPQGAPDRSPPSLTDADTAPPREAESCQPGQEPARHGCKPSVAFCALWPGCADEGLCLVGEGGTACVSGQVLTVDGGSGLENWYLQDSYLDEACRQLGRCHRRGEQGPLQATTYSCARWLGCTIEGRCQYDPGRRACVVPSASFCNRWAGCKTLGKCATAKGGDGCNRCVATAGDCDRLGQCSGERDCGLNTEYGECQGFAHIVCRQQAGCAERGQCAFVEGSCQALLDRDCAASTVCKEQGLCRAGRGGRCISRGEAEAKSCEAAAIETDAYTGPVPGATYRLIDGACRLPTGSTCGALCQQKGLCEAVEEKACAGGVCSEQVHVVCKATQAEHCQKAQVCRNRGHCARGNVVGESIKCSGYAEPFDDCIYQVHSDVCVLSDDGCRRRPECKERGYCGVYSRYGNRWCRPTKDAHCEQSRACKKLGRCAVTGDPSFSEDWCTPAKPEHCARSTQCEEEGTGCTFDPQAGICKG